MSVQVSLKYAPGPTLQKAHILITYHHPRVRADGVPENAEDVGQTGSTQKMMIVVPLQQSITVVKNRNLK
jgi:hypothetical protein